MESDICPPYFKPTKWDLVLCGDCGKVIGATDSKHKPDCCSNRKLTIAPNVPFFVEDMKLYGLGVRGNLLSSNKLNKTFWISGKNLEDIIMKYGISAGGIMPVKWYMWAKSFGIMIIREAK